MRAIVIDDEQLALERFCQLASQFSELEIIGSYQNSLLALQKINELKPNIVFIDIEMPGLSGIDIAKEIIKEFPSMHIVFVTAFPEYAVEAFEIEAIDYLVKPILKERLQNTINRIKQVEKMRKHYETTQNYICCFGELSFYIRNEYIIPSWRTRKAEELFHYLLHFRDQYVSRDVLVELLWSDHDLESAQAQLYSAIYQIRNKLEEYEVNVEIVNNDQRYRLLLHGMKTDVDLLQNGLSTLLNMTKLDIQKYANLLDLYRGHYFENKSYLWAESIRENLRQLWSSHMIELIDLLMNKSRYREALQIAQDLQGKDPYNEQSYFLTMQIYDILDQENSVKKEYKKLKQMLEEEFALSLNEEIEEWFEKWQENI